VNAGETTTFTVTPDTGYTATVSGCGGTLSGTTYTTGLITAACTVNATFSQNIATYTVTATAEANGSISPASQTVNAGATTTFTVTPDSGYTATVSGCGGTLSGTTYTTGPITAACTVNATFSEGGQSRCVEEGQIIQVNGVDRYRVVGSDCSIVADLVTGLDWQRCSVGQTWNVSTQTCDGEALRFTWEQAMTKTAPGGFRLPTIEELRSLVYCSNTGAIGMYEEWPVYCGGTYDGSYNLDFQQPTIVSEAFPDTRRYWHWSSSPSANSPDLAWDLDFDYGSVHAGGYKAYSLYYVRLARGGQ